MRPWQQRVDATQAVAECYARRRSSRMEWLLDDAKYCRLCANFLDLYVQFGKFMIFLYLMNLLSIITQLMSMLRVFFLHIFVHKIFTSKIVTAPKKSTFRMSETNLRVLFWPGYI